MTQLTTPSPIATLKSSRTGKVMQAALAQSEHPTGALERLKGEVQTSGRLARAVVGGQYKTFPWRSLILGVLTALYFVNPMDLVPDVLLPLGYLDDFTAVGIWLTAVRYDLRRFSVWEQAREMPGGSTVAVLETAQNPGELAPGRAKPMLRLVEGTKSVPVPASSQRPNAQSA